MFVMTGNIYFEKFNPLKPSALYWKRHIDNYSDTAKIILPARCIMKGGDNKYDLVGTNDQIKIGSKVWFEVGYNGMNKKVFAGFVSRINYKFPVEFECEGYAYQLRNKYYNNLSFGKTTMKAVINELINGTDIKISSKMSDKIDFNPAQFKDCSAIQILDWIKENYLLTICFFFNEIYVGWRTTYNGELVKHRLNWNVVKDDNIVFNTYKGSVVNIELKTRNKDGTTHKTKATNIAKIGNVKTLKTLITDLNDKQNAANDAQLKNDRTGYSGRITGFLVPFVEPGMTTLIIDAKYKERNAPYFIEGVNGSFDTNGGRQEIEISYIFKDNKNGSK